MSKLLKQVLKENGESQARFSRKLDIPASNFCLIANGKGYCPPAWRKKISEALSLPETELFPEYSKEA